MTRPNKGAGSKDLRLLVRVLTPLLIAGLSLGAVFDYLRAQRLAESHFAEKHQYMADLAAERISEVFREVNKILVLLSDMEELGDDEQEHTRVFTTAVAQMSEHGAILAFHQGPGGEMETFSSTPDRALSALLRSVRRHGSRYEMFVTGPVNTPAAPSTRALICTMELDNHEKGAPLTFPGPGATPRLNDRGRIGLVLDWGVLQEHIASVVRVSKDSYSWVLDEQGRLILHPEHREQLGELALEPPGKKCRTCHNSFDLHRRMTQGEEGIGTITVKGSEEKLVVYTPVTVGKMRWSLAVAAPSRLASMTSHRSLASIFIFTGAIILVMLAGAIMLDREASRRLRAVDRFNRHLESKVAERTAELEAAHDHLSGLRENHTRLERTAVAGEMASIVAHEVRQPLNALSINAQRAGRLLRKGDNASLDKAAAVLGTLQGEIQRINSLVEEHLLAVVRGRGTSLAPIEVDRLVQDAVGFMAAEASRNGVAITFTLAERPLPPMLADEAKVRQVLLNIMLNAIQAMDHGGRITVRTRAEGDEVVVEIQDTGQGIPGTPEDLERVFRPFHTTKEDGTGLGLAICARLVQEMKGRITVTSEPGEGACFHVRLPRVA
jgi:signal transduction histidine kinase